MLAPHLFAVAVDLGILIFLFIIKKAVRKQRTHFGLALLVINHQQILCKTSCFFFLFKFIKASN